MSDTLWTCEGMNTSGDLTLPLGAGRFIPLTITTTISVLLSSGKILKPKNEREGSQTEENDESFSA